MTKINETCPNCELNPVTDDSQELCDDCIEFFKEKERE